MASLTGQTIASTYDALLKITDNGPITASLKQITDGLGNNTPLYLSATTVFVDGNFRVSGAFYDVNNNAGTAGQFLVSTGTGVDWQNISESNLISGTGTNGFISKFTAAGVIADSVIQESGSNIGIGILPTQKLHVDGNGLFTGTLTSSNLSGSNTGDETKASIESKLGAASSSNDGYLTAANWTTFNAKQNQLNGTGFVKVTGTTVSYDNSVYALASRAINTSAPLSGGGDLSANRTLSIARSNSVTDGYLAADDFASFNSRVPSTRTITINGDTQDLSANRTFNVNVGVTSFNTRTGAVVLGSGDVTTALGYTPANSSRIMTINGVGYNLSADRTWNVGTVTSINTSAPLTGGPITSSGTIGITQATTSTNGFLSSTDWNTFNNKQDALGFTPENTANKGIANGYASLDGAGKVPSTQLPSYVDDVVEVLNFAALPATGETGKIYITLDNNFVYRWSGSVYVKISEPNAVWGSITGTLSNQTDLQNALNAKQNTLTNPVTGTGTTNTLPKFTGASAIGNSNITDDGSLITLGSNSLVSGNLSIGATTFSARSSVGLTRNISGDPNSYGIINTGQIQSGVTSLAAYNVTSASTQAASFTLNTLSHYYAEQGTIGAGSTVNTQNGFQVHSSLVGATNNFGFRGGIPAGTGRWNLYMDGTANNFLQGNLGIGTTSLGTNAIAINKATTGGTIGTTVNIITEAQSDVTSRLSAVLTQLSTQATTFTLGNLEHFRAQQGTIGAGSTVTQQNGFVAASNLIGATDNYGFRGSIPSGTGRWNLFMDGTANNYINGALGISTQTLTGFNINIARNLTGAITVRGIQQAYTIQSDVTNAAIIYSSGVSTAAATFTLPQLTHYFAGQGTIGAGSTVTDQHGFRVESTLIGATNNYGFRGQIPAGTNRWNLFMDGTANNHMAGSLGIGTTSIGSINLHINKAITGGTTSYGIALQGAIQSDVTANARLVWTNPSTQATTFTLSNLTHYFANQGTFGAGSTVTQQNGFLVESTLIGATNNYGFRGIIPAGTGRWNLYMDGTAANYLAGNLSIGLTNPLMKLDLYGTSGLPATSGTTPTGSLRLHASNNAVLDFGVDHVTANGWIQSTDQGALNAYYGLLLNPRGGNVGIGLTNPTRKLSISSSLNQPELQIIGTGVNVRAQLETTNDYGTWLWGVTGGDTTGDGIIYSAAAKNLRIFTSDTERMRITSGGAVGIGTSSPNTQLHVAGSLTVNDVFYLQRASSSLFLPVMNYWNGSGPNPLNGTKGDILAIGNAGGDGVVFANANIERMRISGGNVGIGTSAPATRTHFVGGSTTTSAANAATTVTSRFDVANPAVSLGIGYVAEDIPMIQSFNNSTGNASNLTINPFGGAVFVGTTSSSIFGSAGADSGTMITPGNLNLKTNSTSFSYVSGFYNPNGLVGSITTSGSSTAFNTTSDYRLKQDLKDYNGLDLVNKIKTYDYEWKSNNERMYGVMAHELQEVIPYAVVGEKDGEQMQGVDYSKLVPILIKAIQEQQAQIEELKAKLQ